MENQDNNALRPLPINVSSFKRIYEKNMIYVDKTHLIHKFIELPGQYFLSRPRRFGKSLLVSLLYHLFMGDKIYFKDTWIGQNNRWDFKARPVLVFDFNRISHENSEQLERMLKKAMRDMALKYGVTLSDTELKETFAELILALEQKYKSNVIVLVDEYDKPIIDHLNDKISMEIAKENRDVLKNFFGTLKGIEITEAVQLLFITGVSKFSHVSIFSDLNNITDLTMDHEFSTLIGYTEDEIDTYFNGWIKKWSQEKGVSQESIRKKLRDHYNGFRFSEAQERVYNPISILNSLRKKDYRNYWFRTASPTFLINLLVKENFSLPNVETITLVEEDFDSFEIEDLNPTALMFQTGYLTIKDVKHESDLIEYSFDFPNIEVRHAFLRLLMIKFGSIRKNIKYFDKMNFYNNLDNKHFDMAIKAMQSIFHKVPKLDNQNSSWFDQFFYMILRSACPFSRTLNIDKKMVIFVESEQNAFVVAFSCNYNAKEILQCLYKEAYASSYKESDKELYYVSIHFDLKTRTIAEWEYEHINPKPVLIPKEQEGSIKSLKIFLASSNELSEERKEIALWTNRKNKNLLKKNLFIDLVVWEDLLHSFQGERIQEYFNKEMLACDVVIVLFYTKVGEFTKEEFELAYENLKAGKKPKFLFVGFKEAQLSSTNISEDYIEVIQLRKKIEQYEQIYLTFDSTDSLILKIDSQLEKIVDSL